MVNLLRGRCQGEVLGMDANLALLKLAREQYKGLRVFAGDAQAALPLPDRSVEVVISSDVTEHLTDPSEHVREVWTVLQPRGLYIVKTPNRWLDTVYWMVSLSRRRLREGEGFPTAVRQAHKEMRQPGSHCSTQTPGSLISLMRQGGFRLVRMVEQPPSTTQEQKMTRLRGPLGLGVRAAGRMVRRLPLWSQWSLVGVFEKS